jgi:hypothetical protein
MTRAQAFHLRIESHAGVCGPFVGDVVNNLVLIACSQRTHQEHSESLHEKEGQGDATRCDWMGNNRRAADRIASARFHVKDLDQTPQTEPVQTH